eukprot:1161686-Pelagomonas_calceolata.AAC.1
MSQMNNDAPKYCLLARKVSSVVLSVSAIMPFVLFCTRCIRGNKPSEMSVHMFAASTQPGWQHIKGIALGTGQARMESRSASIQCREEQKDMSESTSNLALIERSLFEDESHLTHSDLDLEKGRQLLASSMPILYGKRTKLQETINAGTSPPDSAPTIQVSQPGPHNEDGPPSKRTRSAKKQESRHSQQHLSQGTQGSSVNLQNGVPSIPHTHLNTPSSSNTQNSTRSPNRKRKNFASCRYRTSYPYHQPSSFKLARKQRLE